jgi:hypothetical protein
MPHRASGDPVTCPIEWEEVPEGQDPALTRARTLHEIIAADPSQRIFWWSWSRRLKDIATPEALGEIDAIIV